MGDLFPAGHKPKIRQGGLHADPLGHRGRVQNVRLGKNHQEIVSADPPDDVRGPDDFPKLRRERLEKLISRALAEFVVQGLEIVRVDHQQAQGILVADGPVDFFLQPGFHVHRVVKAGQAVPNGQARELVAESQAAQADHQDDNKSQGQDRTLESPESDPIPVLGDEIAQGDKNEISSHQDDDGPEPIFKSRSIKLDFRAHRFSFYTSSSPFSILL